jgi:hypothetical protein
MKNTRKQKRPVSAENIARLADKGQDVSRFFTNTGHMMSPIQQVADARRIGQRGKGTEHQPPGGNQDTDPEGA